MATKELRLSFSLALGLGSAFGLAAFYSPVAQANAELDRRYSLETIGALRSWDNVDGLFSDYVNNAYRDYFARQGRFRMIELSKADALLNNAKVPYSKTIEDNEVLGQLARSMRTQSLLRTRIHKEGPQYRFKIEWLHSPGMDILAAEEFVLSDPGRLPPSQTDGQAGAGFPGLGDISGTLKIALDRLFKKIPFSGQVTGRDENAVTINLGAHSEIKRGDTLVVGTLDDVKKHPLLKQIVDWRITPTGRLEVDQLDEGIAFCRVTSEEDGRQIGKYQKIIQVIPRPANLPSATDTQNGNAPSLEAHFQESPHLGFASLGLWTGGFSRQFSLPAPDTTGGRAGSGFLYGARGSGQIWFNREFFADAELGYANFGHSQTDIVTSDTSTIYAVSGSVYTMKFDVGYSYQLTSDYFGPKGWVKAGYLITSYTLPTTVTETTAPFDIKSVIIGIGGEFPLRGSYGARLDLDFGLLNTGTETGSSNGTINSSSNARIYLGGYYRYQPRITFQAGLEVHSTGAEFDGDKALSQKTVTFMPSVSYFF